MEPPQNPGRFNNDYRVDDWIAITLVAGQNYRIQLTRDSLANGVVKLYDDLGHIFAYPNESLNTSTTSVIEGTALRTGTYYIAIDSDYTGVYTLSFDTANLPDTLTELQDAPETTATPYRIAIGETFHGNLSRAYTGEDYVHDDWIAISLVAGQSYRVWKTADNLGSYDKVKLYDDHGYLYADPHASGFEGTALISGTYYVGVSGEGNYVVNFITANIPGTLTELQDAPETTATPYRIAVGETFRGDLRGNFVGTADNDYADWIAISLVAGQGYRIQLTKSPSYYGAVKLYDSFGQLFANPNTSLNTTTTSVIEGTALVSDTYYIAVDVNGYYSGNYTVSFTSTTASDTTAPTIILSASDQTLITGETSTKVDPVVKTIFQSI